MGFITPLLPNRKALEGEGGGGGVESGAEYYRFQPFITFNKHIIRGRDGANTMQLVVKATTLITKSYFSTHVHIHQSQCKCT